MLGGGRREGGREKVVGRKREKKEKKEEEGKEGEKERKNQRKIKDAVLEDRSGFKQKARYTLYRYFIEVAET